MNILQSNVADGNMKIVSFAVLKADEFLFLDEGGIKYHVDCSTFVGIDYDGTPSCLDIHSKVQSPLTALNFELQQTQSTYTVDLLK